MRLPLLLSLALLVGFLAGCDSSTPSGPDAAPVVLAPAAFTIPTDAFPPAAAATAVGQNYVTAAARVAIVTGIVGLNLVVPKAATDAATRVTPTVENGTFVWSTSVDVLGRPVAILLFGTPRSSEVEWRLTTAADGDAPFTLYTATTSLDGRDGTWTLFNPNVSGAVATADFEVDATPEITFRVAPGRDGAGNSVRYEGDGDERTFDFFDAQQDVRSLVRWDQTGRTGSITATDYNGGARACWDAQLNDTPCSGA